MPTTVNLNAVLMNAVNLTPSYRIGGESMPAMMIAGTETVTLY